MNIGIFQQEIPFQFLNCLSDSYAKFRAQLQLRLQNKTAAQRQKALESAKNWDAALKTKITESIQAGCVYLTYLYDTTYFTFLKQYADARGTQLDLKNVRMPSLPDVIQLFYAQMAEQEFTPDQCLSASAKVLRHVLYDCVERISYKKPEVRVNHVPS